MRLIILLLVFGSTAMEQVPNSRAENAMLCSTLEEETAALEKCEDAIRQGLFGSGSAHPETLRFFERLGTAAERLGRFDDAHRVYRAATRVFPDEPDPYQRLGTLLVRRWQAYSEAWGPLMRAVQLGSKSSEVLLLLAQTNLRLEMPQEALTTFKEVLKLQPASVDAQLGSAQASITLGRPTDAIEALRNVPAQNLEGMLLRAEALLKLNRPSEAEILYRSVFRENYLTGIASCGLAKTLAAQSRQDEAKVECARAKDIDPKCSCP